MKIAVVSREHPCHFNGGLAIAALNTARAARDVGIDVTYITAERPDGFHGQEEIDGIRIIWMAGTTNIDYPLFLKTILSSFPSYHKRIGFDLVHGHGYSAASLAKTDLYMPIIFHDHGSKAAYIQTLFNDAKIRDRLREDETLLDEYIDAMYFAEPFPAGECDFVHMRRYDKVLATSTISLWDYRTRYLLKNAVLFRHCIYDLDEQMPRTAKSPPIVGLFAGSLDSAWKAGIPALEKLLPMKDEIKLKMIGEGPTVAKWAKVHFPNVEYVGHLPEKDAMRELAEVDVLFEPSTHHLGLNLTGISALGLGIPIVAYTTGGHWDMIGDDEDAGILVDPIGDDVCGAINNVLVDRRPYGMYARARFEKIFSPEVCAQNIKEIYESLL